MQTLSPALRQLIIAMGDDALILGHRNSEWTGLGPVMEEDIAFSSMAQDKIGHAWALYRVLHEHGGPDPDAFAFLRLAEKYTCCHLVEQPIGEYDFSLMRHFLFDHAEALRYEALADSSFVPLQQLARKIKGELKYHTLHANAWIIQLAQAGEEGKARMQAALEETLPLALGIFEPLAQEAELIASGVYCGEAALQQRWWESLQPILAKAGLALPATGDLEPAYGGRSGWHTQYLAPLLDEMGAVFRLDPEATW
ncbi:phenylacetate-CoA oxygenase subunit PaaI [Chitinophaga parva]|uniref:Phenylacetate-CoA oxygenase subunit PaaI n=1 Tax=Chitinophaga parva TaxID=2169414 RepID=A0A2T7BL20_9BACT|nr:1,2-phenylacetyl-CoA epoxidase subunit PaaC [Chitinophaga parva]PUZ28377.1 phenylacetate-CoA oxygenase subunit PaaI [Chitinophaga parva]